MSFLSLVILAAAGFRSSQAIRGSDGQLPLGISSSCPNAQLSCHSTVPITNTCCYNEPGGQFALTQFWNTDPSKSQFDYLGPTTSWTLHGLWPDHCDGTFDSACDSSRNGDCSRGRCNGDYSSITAILSSFGQSELLNYMGTYWKGINGDEHIWQHEWSKHGTCVSSIEPKCYENYHSTQEVVDYFRAAVDIFKPLKTYEWLAAAGITPSDEETYELADIETALESARGAKPVVSCDDGELREVWYHFNVRGSVQGGQFVAVDPDFSGVNGGPLKGDKKCPKTGVRYLPKPDAGEEPTRTPRTTVATSTAVTKTTAVGPTPTGTSSPSDPFEGRGYLMVRVDGVSTGCLISSGKWYTSGTCATYTAVASGSEFTLSSSRGNCAVRNNELTCGSSISSPSSFTSSGGKMAFDGRVLFFANDIPSGTGQETVYTSDQGGITLELVWHSL